MPEGSHNRDISDVLLELRSVLRAKFGIRRPLSIRVTYQDEDGKHPLLLPFPPTPEPGTVPTVGHIHQPHLQPRKRSEVGGCAGDVLAILREVGTRLTCPEILEELAERKKEWSERSVRRWLAWLKDEGFIDHDGDAAPPGYGVLV